MQDTHEQLFSRDELLGAPVDALQAVLEVLDKARAERSEHLREREDAQERVSRNFNTHS